MAVKNLAPQNSASSPQSFLQLPAEIRNQIYGYILIKPNAPIDLCPWNYIDDPREDDRLRERLQKKKNTENMEGNQRSATTHEQG